MSQDFYELLGVSPHASQDEIRQAFQRRLSHLVRRLRAAQNRGADISSLKAQERDLQEAMKALSDTRRRRSYDVFRAACERGIPDDAQQLWEQAKQAYIPPKVAAACHTLSVMTRLPLASMSILNQESPLPMDELPTAPRIENIPPLRNRKRSQPRKDRPTNRQATPPNLNQPPEQRIETPIRVSLSPTNNNDSAGNHLDMLASRFGHDGRFLRAVRERQRRSLEEISVATRVSVRYLKAIEENAFELLPAATFVKGYIKSIVRELSLDDRPVVQDFMALFRQQRR